MFSICIDNETFLNLRILSSNILSLILPTIYYNCNGVEIIFMSKIWKRCQVHYWFDKIYQCLQNTNYFTKLPILNVKERPLVSDLVTCYSKDAQREWMKLSSEVTWTKVRNPEKVCKQLFSEEEDSGHIKCRYRVISRLISIKVSWESFHPNTPIKGEL